MKDHLSKSSLQTQRIARHLVDLIKPGAILALVGELGTGKTQFVKGLAQRLQIKENITSPTFVLIKKYPFKNNKYLIHVDCYRLNNTRELIDIGFLELISDKNNLVIVEWAEKIKKILPKNTKWIYFKHGKKENERIINY